MKRSWTIRRQSQAMPDAQNRWDRAFQLLLRCSNLNPQSTTAAPLADNTQEMEHESRTLCTCLDQPAGSRTID
jgi:hypothetical protein